ncbi:alpha/beta hydrolase [Nocardia cyriacigeorgica]|uniref:alpha/beta hydrolase n=1 Tax=Nocardia cyriacigeorgica TaxID=135487 RepID=UPI001894CFB8|nr:alpha/beta hydrolase [Nocardia cyriacigeorgica]MBF6394475.1 alpha/beta hydrolase [Nocardia cyriacigeorgica]MBF6400110.1 alpha/beta hydrolase [Nocardia cyriacigeorgica]
MIARVVAAVLAAACLLATGAAWSAGLARAEVMAPAEPHHVGRVDTVLASGTRSIPLSIWYPTDVVGSAPYIPGSTAAVRAQLAAEAALWLRTPGAAPAMTTTVLPVVEGAPLAGDRLPVVVWSPGMGTPLAREWSAHGPRIARVRRAAIDHTGESPAVEIRGRVRTGTPPISGDPDYMRAQLDTRVADARHVLDQLDALPVIGGHVDHGRIAMAGHSYGGQTAVSTAAADDRVRTVIVLDGSAAWDGVGPAPDIDRPVLLLANGMMVHASWLGPDAMIGTLEGGGHYTPTDLPMFGGGPEFCGTINPDTGARLTREVVAAWLIGESMPEDPALRWRL